MTTVPEEIEREIVIEAAPDTVWAAITKAEHLGAWFSRKGARVDLRPGGALRFDFDVDGGTHTGLGVVEKVDPPHLFAFRWARSADEEPHAANSTLVEFTLTPEGAGTRLRVVESGFRDELITEQEQVEHARGNADGWRIQLGRVHEYLTAGQ
jgi:uncharacterized protein YndB with AHSA1/START domain